MKVLVVDDSRSARKLIAHYLQEMGHQPLEAEQADQALEVYANQPPDLVLTDIDMPGMNGYELAKAMRNTDQDGEWIPIIFLSSRVRDKDVARGLDAGGDDYLTKPVSPVVLSAKLHAMSRITDMRNRLVKITHELQVANENLTRMSSLDGLTNIANRRAFDTTFAEQWQRCLKRHQPISLILGDIDYFKRYNDAYGHAQGDTCLKDVASAMASAARGATIVARFGGEEFATLVTEEGHDAAALKAERVLRRVRALRRPHSGSKIAPYVTTSLGVATCIPTPAMQPIDLIKAADKALYQAKASGRNCYISEDMRAASKPNFERMHVGAAQL